MSESGRESEDYDDSCNDSSGETEYTDNIHSSDDETVEESSEDESESEGMRRRMISEKNNVPIRKLLQDDPQIYAPERWPPIFDFLFVFSSFVVAVAAAYFTIF